MKYAKGIAFPFRKGNASFPAVAEDEDLIRQSIIQIIGVAPRERVMRPQFGCNAQAYVFEANDDLLPELVATDIRASLAQNEPRIVVKNVTSEAIDEQLITTIEYIVIASRKEQTLQVTL